MTDLIELKVSDVVFRDDLYPRVETSPATVQKYAEDLEVLPPIEVNQNNELIDGWNRWTAHKKAEAETIRAIVTPTETDAEFLELAIERNAKHGLQLSLADKRSMARRIYGATPIAEQAAKKKRLAEILSVTEKTIQNWLSDTDRDNKEARDAEIFGMWLACYSQDEIAQTIGLTQKGIGKVLEQMESFRFVLKPGAFSEIAAEDERLDAVELENRSAADHKSDFEIPCYNVWTKAAKTNEVSHFGNSEATWVDRLLYAYTQPFDIVVDPFAGGGSTIDVCRKRLRRYYVSDRKPIVERANEIREHDIKDGLPKPPNWKDVSLVYLDPPYWIQAEGQYSDDSEDLANMPLEQFTKTLADLISSFAKKLKASKRDRPAYIALIIQPTQWKAPERQFTDHIADMLREVSLPVEMRIQAPYSTEQCNAQMVLWAKEHRRFLVISREIVVWRVG